MAIALTATEPTGGTPGAVLLGLGRRELPFAGALGPVIAGENDESAFTKTQIVERRHKTPEGVVKLGDISVVLADAGVLDIGVGFLELGVALDGKVGLVGPDGDKKGLVGIAFVLEPMGRFIGDERSGESFQRSDFLVISNEVLGVFVGRRSVVLSGEPPVVAVIIRLGLLVAVEVAVEMPFPAVHRFGADGAKELGGGELGSAEMGFVPDREPAPNAIPIGSAAHEDGGTGGRANGARGVSLCEADAFGREFIEVRSLDARVAVTCEVPPTPGHRREK
ncbi:MAG: hypothetical protein ACJAVK_001503 [Akkermansiaceae bacterium]|jgi:hypothetical protein